MLDRTMCGFHSYVKTINDVLYKQLETLLPTIYGFIKATSMRFGLKVCTKSTLKTGKLIRSLYITPEKSKIRRELNRSQNKKYFEINELDLKPHRKENVRNEYWR